MHISEKFESYPNNIKLKLEYLRDLIFEVAREDNIEDLSETLKWGQLSYVSKGGSTIRIDWKAKSPEEYAMYFHCKTKLVDTFREVHGETFKYSGNRAIIFPIDGEVPEKELKYCISLSLRYHSIKNMPLLGA